MRKTLEIEFLFVLCLKFLLIQTNYQVPTSQIFFKDINYAEKKIDNSKIEALNTGCLV